MISVDVCFVHCRLDVVTENPPPGTCDLQDQLVIASSRGKIGFWLIESTITLVRVHPVLGDQGLVPVLETQRQPEIDARPVTVVIRVSAPCPSDVWRDKEHRRLIHRLGTDRAMR